MPNFLKRVSKKKADELQPDERFIAALYAQPAGSFGIAAGILAGGITTHIATKSAEKRSRSLEGADATGRGSEFPAKHVVMALTNDRLLVYRFSHSRNNITDLLLEIPVSAIADLGLEQRTAHKRLLMRFSDGSVADLDMVYGSKPGPFIDAFEELKR